MKALPLDYQGMMIHASRDAWFNATEVAEAHGKRLDNFFALKRTQTYLAALQKQAGHGDISNPLDSRDLKTLARRYPAFIKTVRGNNGGTWLHPDLMVCFARWISVDFEIWCDQAIRQLLTEQPAWLAARTESKLGAQVMAEILQSTRAARGKQTLPHHYANEHKLCNSILCGAFAGIDRDNLTLAQQSRLARIQARNAVMIAQGASRSEREASLQTLHLEMRP